MGKRHLEEVRKWMLAHPPPPPEADEIELAVYRSQAPSVETMRAAVTEFFEEVGSPADKARRTCLVCAHPFKDHVPGSPCECCTKGVRVIPKGTDIMGLALALRGLK